MGRKDGTVLSDVNALVSFCDFLGSKNMDTEVTRDHVLDYVTIGHRVRMWRNADRSGQDTITTRTIPLKASTLGMRKTVLKAFYRWLRQTDDYPPEVAKIGGRVKDQDTVVADRLIGEGDIRRMIAAQPDARGRAMLAVLYETGLREQELCALNLSSVEFVDKWGHITIPKGAPGLKTGSRRVLIIDSVRYLHAWMEEHPFRNDPGKPLFLSMSRRRPQVRFSPNAVYVFCVRAGRKGLTKMRTNPHLFRHSAATEKARLGWNEAQMRHYFGWTRNSDMPARYVHLASQDYEKMELSRRHLLTDGSRPEPALRPIKCKPCGASNSPTANYCEQCRLPISPEAAENQRQRQLDDMKEWMAQQVQTALKQAMKTRPTPIAESSNEGMFLPSS